MLNHPTLNRRLQKGQGMWGHARKDHMTNIGKILGGCGKQSEKGADKPKKDERIGWSKLRRMGMMGKWMEAKTQLGIGVKLTIGSPLSVY